MAGSDEHTAAAADRTRDRPLILVGRENERRLLSEALVIAAQGDGRLVLLGGEAGIGKTSLARDLATEAERQGMQYLAGYCFEVSSAPPYGPWLEIFRRHRNDAGWPTAPEAFRSGQLGPVRDQAAFFAEVRAFFEELVVNQPALLLLEDLHWADPASIELLRSLAPTFSDMAVLVIATYRSDELLRDRPLAQLLPALVREGNAVRVDLKRLDHTALLQMTESRYRLTGEDTARLVAYVERHTDGNPFFAVELLRALEEEGLLRAGIDRSHLGELARVVVPSLLQQVIDGRVTRMGESTRRSLEIAAVIGQEVPLELWASLSRLDQDSLFAIVEQAVASHLMEAMRNGTHVRFVHALTREAIYEGMFPPRRRLLHQRVAEALASETCPNPEGIAFHFQSAGDIRAIPWLQRAADQAQSAYAWLTAAELLRVAAEMARNAEGQETLYCRLILRIAYLLRFSYPAEAAQLLEEAEHLARSSSDRVASAQILHLRGTILCYSNRFLAGTELLDHGLEELLSVSIDERQVIDLVENWLINTVAELPSFDEATAARVGRQLNAGGFHILSGFDYFLLASAGRPQRALDKETQLLKTLETLPNLSWVTSMMHAFALNGLGVACAMLGRSDVARRHRQEATELFSEVSHHTLTAFSLLGQLREVEFTFRPHEPDRRQRVADEASAALARAGGALRPGVSPRLALLGCLVLDGHWHQADEILGDLPDPGNVFLRREVALATAFLARQRSDPLRAWQEISSVLPDGQRTEPGNTLFLDGLFMQRLAAELCIDDGELAQARSWLEAHDRWLDWGGAVLGRADGQLAWAEWHRSSGDPDDAIACATTAIELASDPDQPLVLLGAHRLLGELETAAGNVNSAASSLAASLDLAVACGAPFERARTLLALAQLSRVEGNHDAMSVFLSEVAEISERLGACMLRSQAQRVHRESASSGPSMGLTSREIQVLRLLAMRRTNAEIADEMFISRRTVTTHVEHIFSKLGVRSRAEAEQVARDSRLI